MSISISGIKIRLTTKAKLGKSFSDFISFTSPCNLAISGISICTFLLIKVPKTGPAKIIAGIPAIIPNRITQPKSTPSIFATVIGPGVGGTNACVTANPANKGIP